MKTTKIIAIIMSILFVFSLSACGNDQNKSEDSSEVKVTVDGKYLLYSIEADGETVEYETLKFIGMDKAYLEINGDKFTMDLGDEDRTEGTHNKREKKLIGPDSDAITYIIEGEKIIIEADGSKMIFAKEGSELFANNGESSNVMSADGDVCGTYVLVGEGYSAGNYSEPYTPGYVVLNDDGTGIYCSNETEMDLAWSIDGEDFTGTVTMFGEMGMNGTLIDGVLEVVYGDGFYLKFEKGEVDINKGAYGVQAYAGDWHGAIYYKECTGKYADVDGDFSEIIARLIIDEDGQITPFLAVALGGSNDKNLKNIELAHYDENGYDFLLLKGEFLKTPLLDDSYIERDGDVLNIYFGIDDGEGNALSIYGCLRHLDDEWDEENDYAYFPEDMYNFYYGKTLEEIAELYGFEKSDLPNA